MSHPAFNVLDLGISSALQLTLWPGRPEFCELTAEALTHSELVIKRTCYTLLGTIL